MRAVSSPLAAFLDLNTRAMQRHLITLTLPAAPVYGTRTIALVGVGTFSTTPSIPAGVQDGDILILDSAAVAPAGWSQGPGSYSIVSWRRVAGSVSAPNLGSDYGRISAYRGCVLSGSPIEAYSNGQAVDADVARTLTTLTDGAQVVFVERAYAAGGSVVFGATIGGGAGNTVFNSATGATALEVRDATMSSAGTTLPVSTNAILTSGPSMTVTANFISLKPFVGWYDPGSTIIRWTDHESNLTLDGDTFVAGGTGTAPLLKIGKRRDPAGTEIGECELVLMCGDSATLSGTPIPLAVVNDVLDGATVRIDRVFGIDSIDLSLGAMRLFDGVVAEADPSSTEVTLSLVDPREELNVELPRTPLQPPCTAMLFDGQCSLDKSAYTVKGTVASGSTGWKVRSNRTEADGYFDLGLLTFDPTTATVALRNVKRAVRSYLHANGELEVNEALPATPAAGDTFSVYPGCDKGFATCGTKFSNQIHFRGFPFLPAETADTRAIFQAHGGGSTSYQTWEPGPWWGGIGANVTPPDLVLPIVYGRQKIRGQIVYRIGPYSSQGSTAVVIAFAEGPIVGSRRCWVGDKFYAAVPLSIWPPSLASSSDVFYIGARPTQSAWPFLNIIDPAAYPANYPGVAYWGAQGLKFPVGAAPTYEVEIDGFLSAAGDAGADGDAHPASIIGDATYGLLPNATFGAGFSWPVITDTGTDGTAGSSARRYLTASGLLLSPLIDSKRKAIDILQEILDSCNCSCRVGDGALQIVPLGDVAFTANGATYTPDTTVQYAIDEDDYLTGGTEDPVGVKRPARETVYNVVPVEFTERDPTAAATDPSHAYKSRQIEDPEPVDVGLNGPRRSGAVSLPMICLSSVALTISRLRAQRAVKRRNVYTFKVGFRFARLQPLDYITISDRCFGLTGRVVRIRSVEEDGDVLAIEAEDAPIGMSHAIAHPTQSSESAFAGKPWIDLVNKWAAAATVTWERVSLPNASSLSACWSGRRWVTVGSSAAAYTDDQLARVGWTAATGVPAGTYYYVASDGAGVCVAVGDSGALMRSTDFGATWAAATGLPNRQFIFVLWDAFASQFVALGGLNADACATSPTGASGTWTQRTLPSTGFSTVARNAQGTNLIAVGQSVAAYSTDNGATWIPTALPSALYRRIVNVMGRTLALSQANWIAETVDGTVWSETDIAARLPGGYSMRRWGAFGDVIVGGRTFGVAQVGYPQIHAALSSLNGGRTFEPRFLTVTGAQGAVSPEDVAYNGVVGLMPVTEATGGPGVYVSGQIQPP